MKEPITAEKIRADFNSLDYRAARYDDRGELGAHGDILLAQANYLAEIAAQLAELNATLKARGAQ